MLKKQLTGFKSLQVMAQCVRVVWLESTSASNYIITTTQGKFPPGISTVLFQLGGREQGNTSSSSAASSQSPHPPPSRERQTPASGRFLPNLRHLIKRGCSWEARPARSSHHKARCFTQSRTATVLSFLPYLSRSRRCSPTVACRAACIAASVSNP